MIRDAAELKVKESNRIATVAEELRKLGARVEETPDGMVIEGPTPLRGGLLDSHGDHRIGMAMAVAGLAADGGVGVNGEEAIAVFLSQFRGDPQGIGSEYIKEYSRKTVRGNPSEN